MRLLIALLAMLVTFSLAVASPNAQVPVLEDQDCVPNTRIVIAGKHAPPNAALLIRFADRTVGGGISDAQGHYSLVLVMGREQPGEYEVTVEQRATRRPVARMTCWVPQPDQIRPTPRDTTATPLPRITATATAGSPGAPAAPTASVTTPTPMLPEPTYIEGCNVTPVPSTARNYPVKIVTVDKERESVRLQNTSNQTVDLTGWHMCSIETNVANQEHRGLQATLAPGAIRDFPSQATRNIWNNQERDDGALYDAEGRLISYWEDPSR